MKNYKQAIYIDTYNDNITIYDNDFINNNQSIHNILNSFNQTTTQVYENQLQNVSNYWDFNGIGNYWSDYNYRLNANESIGTIPMHILAVGSDTFPVLHPMNNTYIFRTQSQNNHNYDLLHMIESNAIPIVSIKYSRLKKVKGVHSIEFTTFLKQGLKQKRFKEHQTEKVSDETFKKIEEIIDENKE